MAENSRLSYLISLFAILSVFTLPGSSAGTIENRRTVSHHTVYEFPSLTWIENIHVRQNGELLVTILGPSDVYIIDPLVSSLGPKSNASAQLLHSYPPNSALLGITEVNRDQFYVIAGNYSLATGSLDQGSFSVWSLDLRNYTATTNNQTETNGVEAREIATFPTSGLPNGMDALNPSQNLVVFSDSLRGVVFLLNVETGENSVLLDEPEMKPPVSTSVSLGINGLKVLREGDTAYIYFSNTGLLLFCRIPVHLSTLQKSGPVEILHNGTSIDDFVLDPEDKVAYVAGGSLNSLFSIPLSGGRAKRVLGGLNSTLLPGPTSAALGRGSLGKGEVYVATNGGIEGAVNGNYTEGGKVLAVDTRDYY